MAVTQMIIVAFAVTVFLIGAILGLRFRVVVLIAPIIVGFVAIVAVGIASGNGAGFILFVVFLGFIWIAFDHNHQAWHDKIAGTVVVRAKRGPPL